MRGPAPPCPLVCNPLSSLVLALSGGMSTVMAMVISDNSQLAMIDANTNSLECHLAGKTV
jgi:hypothetical protein